MQNVFDQTYWENRYQEGQTGWDIGYASTPLKSYVNQLENKDISILIPGAGNAWEAAYLHETGFNNVHVLDWAKPALDHLLKICPEFPAKHLIQDDFFNHQGQYDLIIEQTFFCALHPDNRIDYLKQMLKLLKPEGKLAGLLFATEFEKEGPPYGGSQEEYEALFGEYFNLQVMEGAYNSIEPRRGNEVFFIAKKMKQE